MSRFSRFDKLESERRPAKEAEPGAKSSGASLERFGELPAARGQPEDVAPVEAQPALDRFAADGVGALRTNDDELTRLPFLECPACKGQAGKFDTTCFNCGARLDTREARAHNLARLEALKAERAEAKAREVARREEEIAEVAARRAAERAVLEGKLEDIERAHGGGDNELARYLGVWVSIVISALLAMELSSGVRWFFALVAVVLVMTRIPMRVWVFLGRHVQRP